MTYILDTNVVSELTRPRADERVLTWIDSLDEDETFLSVMTVAELRQGIMSVPQGKKRNDLNHWFEAALLERYRDRVIDVSLAVADRWGRLAAQARSDGLHVHFMDGFIAATALVHSHTVATRNVRDFQRLGVKVLNPWQD